MSLEDIARDPSTNTIRTTAQSHAGGAFRRKKKKKVKRLRAVASEHNNYNNNSVDFYSVDASAQGGVTEYDNGSQEHLYMRHGGAGANVNSTISVPGIV